MILVSYQRQSFKKYNGYNGRVRFCTPLPRTLKMSPRVCHRFWARVLGPGEERRVVDQL